MRYLAIDLGDRRTGLAIGDDVTGLVSPHEVIEQPCGDHLLRAILDRIETIGPDELIIGLPLNMDGTEGPRAKTTRAFGDSLAARIDRPLHYQDERLTSFDAEQRMAGSGRTHKQKKQIRDALAAAAILEDFLESRSK